MQHDASVRGPQTPEEGPAGTLVLLRHGKSDWSGAEPDRLRPLARRGRRQAAEAGRWLAEHVGRVDLAVVSPAVRARETWRLAAAELAAPVPFQDDDRVYAGSAGSLLDVVQELPGTVTSVVLVGHDPGLEDLVACLTGRSVRMPTSALAVLEVPGPWSSIGSLGAELRALGRPPLGQE